MADEKKGVKCLLDTIIDRVPHPNVKIAKADDKIKMLISQTESS